MKTIFKKYCAFLFLVAFVFPIVEKELHAFEHANDFHCTASDKHFHEQEHHCNICDYTFLDVIDVVVAHNNFVISVQSFHYSQFIENAFSPSAFSDTPLRAPPLA